MLNVGGGRWAERRRDYDSANDPVTVACSRNSRCGRRGRSSPC